MYTHEVHNLVQNVKSIDLDTSEMFIYLFCFNLREYVHSCSMSITSAFFSQYLHNAFFIGELHPFIGYLLLRLYTQILTISNKFKSIGCIVEL